MGLHLIKKKSNILHIVKLVNYFMNLKEKNKIIGAFLGTIVEYYDYSLYAFSAAVIASKFFPKSEKVTLSFSIKIPLIYYCHQNLFY